MFLRSQLFPYVCLSLFACALLALPACSQQDDESSSQSQSDTASGRTVEGTVVASSRITFVVRSDDNQFHLFTYDRNAHGPRALAVGTRVRVVSDEGDQPGARRATDVYRAGAGARRGRFCRGTERGPGPRIRARC